LKPATSKVTHCINTCVEIINLHLCKNCDLLVSKITYLYIIKGVYNLSGYYHPEKTLTDTVNSFTCRFRNAKPRLYSVFRIERREKYYAADGRRNAHNSSYKLFIVFDFCQICRHCTVFWNLLQH